jgi:hypothetical protein
LVALTKTGKDVEAPLSELTIREFKLSFDITKSDTNYLFTGVGGISFAVHHQMLEFKLEKPLSSA